MRSGVLLLLFTILRIFEASRIRVHLPLSYSPSRSQLLTILSRSRPADLPQGSNGVHGEIAWMIEKVWDYVIHPTKKLVANMTKMEILIQASFSQQQYHLL